MTIETINVGRGEVRREKLLKDIGFELPFEQEQFELQW